MAPEQPIPEKARVKKYHATERYGAIWVALEDPKYDIFEPMPFVTDPLSRLVKDGPNAREEGFGMCVS